jgi:hypothetical protein
LLSWKGEVYCMKCKIHGVEMVCPVCVGASGGKIGGKAKTAAKKNASRENLEKARAARQKKSHAPKREPFDRSAIWGRAEAVAYLEKHPQEEVTAADLIKAATSIKKHSAEKYAAQRLFMLCNEGLVTKVRRGVYRVANQSR